MKTELTNELRDEMTAKLNKRGGFKSKRFAVKVLVNECNYSIGDVSRFLDCRYQMVYNMSKSQPR